MDAEDLANVIADATSEEMGGEVEVTEVDETLRGGYYFDVRTGGRTFTVLVTEDRV